MFVLFVFIYYPYLKTFFIAFYRDRRRGRRERKRENINWLPSCTHPDREWNPKPGYVLWLGTVPLIFLCMGWCSNQLHHAGQGSISVYWMNGLINGEYNLLIHVGIIELQCPKGSYWISSLQRKEPKLPCRSHDFFFFSWLLKFVFLYLIWLKLRRFAWRATRVIWRC